MFKNEVVLIEWDCLILHKTIRAFDEAVARGDLGWLCDCGHWVSGSDRYHVVHDFGVRCVFYKDAEDSS